MMLASSIGDMERMDSVHQASRTTKSSEENLSPILLLVEILKRRLPDEVEEIRRLELLVEEGRRYQEKACQEVLEETRQRAAAMVVEKQGARSSSTRRKKKKKKRKARQRAAAAAEAASRGTLVEEDGGRGAQGEVDLLADAFQEVVKLGDKEGEDDVGEEEAEEEEEKKKKKKEEEVPKEECPICLHEMVACDEEEGVGGDSSLQITAVPECGHAFHRCCLMLWEERRSVDGLQFNCPYCRGLINT